MARIFRSLVLPLSALATAFAADIASAHVAAHGPAYAGTTQVIAFTIGHGCEGADTVALRIELPAGLESVRPLPGPFGNASITKGADGLVSAVTWTKAEAASGDDHYYEFAIRMQLPNTPFRTLSFPATQTCRGPSGDSVVEWTEIGAEHDHSADASAPAAEQPAPSVFLMPPHKAGWNKYTADAHLHDLSIWDDAVIVWAGDAAYSPNPNTMDLIRSEPGVQPLAEIHPGMEISGQILMTSIVTWSLGGRARALLGGRALAAVVSSLLVSACDDRDVTTVLPTTVEPPPSTSALERPNELPRPPASRLPADLFPPTRRAEQARAPD